VADELTKISQDSIYAQYAYLTYSDILKACPGKALESGTLLAIQAAKGTKVGFVEPTGSG